jgi:hypothetical protein
MPCSYVSWTSVLLPYFEFVGTGFWEFILVEYGIRVSKLDAIFFTFFVTHTHAFLLLCSHSFRRNISHGHRLTPASVF